MYYNRYVVIIVHDFVFESNTGLIDNALLSTINSNYINRVFPAELKVNVVSIRYMQVKVTYICIHLRLKCS